MPLLSADSGKPDAEDEATLPLFSDQSEPARSRPSTGRSVSSLGIARTVEHTSPVATIPFQKLLFRQPHQNYVECAFRRRLGTIVGRSEIGALITGYSIKRERYGPIICQFGSSPAKAEELAHSTRNGLSPYRINRSLSDRQSRSFRLSRKCVADSPEIAKYFHCPIIAWWISYSATSSARACYSLIISRIISLCTSPHFLGHLFIPDERFNLPNDPVFH